jgi:MinD superfamily P-loop ATPase
VSKLRIVIASGKGGTGKTFVSTNLAYSLALNKSVQLIDCDVEEPNTHLFLPMTQPKIESVKTLVPVINHEKCLGCGLCAKRCQYNALSVIKGKVLLFSDICHSCGGCVLYCPNQAIEAGSKEIGSLEMAKTKNIDLVVGRLKVRAIQAPEVIQEALSKEKKDSLTIVDAPPGTSCSAITTVKTADFCLLVTEPTPFGLHDLELAVNMAKALNVPVGVIINKYETCGSVTERFCLRHEIPIIQKIPLQREVATAYAEGKLISEQSSKYEAKFSVMLSNIERVIKND